MNPTRVFEQFPEDKVCPVCMTNNQAPCVLLIVDGTQKDRIAEARPVHLDCAVATHYNPEYNVIYRPC